MGAESRMIKTLAYATAGILTFAIAATADETVPKTTDEAAVVCDACSARKQGLLKKKEAREATKAETASLTSQQETSED